MCRGDALHFDEIAEELGIIRRKANTCASRAKYSRAAVTRIRSQMLERMGRINDYDNIDEMDINQLADAIALCAFFIETYVTECKSREDWIAHKECFERALIKRQPGQRSRFIWKIRMEYRGHSETLELGQMSTVQDVMKSPDALAFVNKHAVPDNIIEICKECECCKQDIERYDVDISKFLRFREIFISQIK